jgi:hypothetical protein
MKRLPGAIAALRHGLAQAEQRDRAMPTGLRTPSMRQQDGHRLATHHNDQHPAKRLFRVEVLVGGGEFQPNRLAFAQP